MSNLILALDSIGYGQQTPSKFPLSPSTGLLLVWDTTTNTRSTYLIKRGRREVSIDNSELIISLCSVLSTLLWYVLRTIWVAYLVVCTVIIRATSAVMLMFVPIMPRGKSSSLLASHEIRLPVVHHRSTPIPTNKTYKHDLSLRSGMSRFLFPCIHARRPHKFKIGNRGRRLGNPNQLLSEKKGATELGQIKIDNDVR